MNGMCQQLTNNRKDSTALYKRIESFSEKRKVTRFLYHLVFRPVNPGNITEPVVREVKKTYYKKFEGKVIRDIYIVTLDPFGYNPRDSTDQPRSLFQKAGNYLHIKSLPLSIKNRLIIKKNEPFDSLKVRESERLIRSQSFVREVFFSPVLTNNSDSVDIYIRVYDVWSIIVTGAVSTASFNINARDKNFLGLGHQFQEDYSLDHTTGIFSNTTDYYISNIRNTYINATLHYDFDNNKNYMESCDIQRPFYSALTRWAGGTYFLKYYNRTTLNLSGSDLLMKTYKNYNQDYWLGRSWQLFRGNAENERTTNFIFSTRYIRGRYFIFSPISPDTLNKENFFLIGGGLSKRKYKQDSYVFKYGFTEDVPIGRVYSIVGGYQVKNNVGRLYLGTRIYWAEYYQWGYFSSNIEYGTFINNNRWEEGCFSVGINYFSPLLRLGRWKMRQFLKPQFVQGVNRLTTDNISLNNELGISGFNSTGLSGTQKITFVLQTQSYAPWNIWGFRFGPYFVFSFGILGTESAGFRYSRIYSQYGLGLLIKNEFLVISSFEVSFAYFPYVPGIGNNIFRTNPFQTTDFGFRDASIERPSPVSYQ